MRRPRLVVSLFVEYFSLGKRIKKRVQKHRSTRLLPASSLREGMLVETNRRSHRAHGGEWIAARVGAIGPHHIEKFEAIDAVELIMKINGDTIHFLARIMPDDTLQDDSGETIEVRLLQLN